MLLRLRNFWWKLVGNPEHLPLDHRAFNVIGLITIVLLLILIPLNIALKLWVVSGMLVIIEAILVFLVLRSRIYGKYTFSLLFYAIASYIVVTITFLYNSGSEGPALYLFLLTYLFLIAFTNPRLHRVWTILHLLIPVTLLGLEYFMPYMLVDNYVSPGYRYFDIATTLIIIVVCIYSITIYLRSNYEREKSTAEQHARKIEAQNNQISAQNRLLQESNSEKLRLISILAHDLRNPMNAITGVLEILTKEELPDEVRKAMKTELLAAARNTSELLDNLLSWTTGQIKGLKPIATKIEPEIIIANVLEVQQFIANKKGITIRTHLEEDVKIWADMDMLELIIRNLISNALKFTPKNGTITISLYKNADDSTCTLAIQDNGIGIADEDLRRLFDKNVQSTYGTESEKGIGLGLYLSKELATLNQGKMWVQSTLGEGSTFFVSFPLHKDKKQPITVLTI
ncbi:sensor histidine kinase [Parapedobacter koreensis]|uniref:histidine kinase n=1 Tax=Parapedobacter koreensis TaxID=332977 RepID=A0A1H7SXA1_9SPHI|nr:HAMP domain-containing sensor histidine kinase [Parapedobacter koreensis]SEL76167.1 Signal transduction histidine kinase [Parapedobacter koreensis]